MTIETTVAKPFVFRQGHKNVLIPAGTQQLTQQQYLHAKHRGYLATPTPKKKPKPLPEVTPND